MNNQTINYINFLVLCQEYGCAFVIFITNLSVTGGRGGGGRFGWLSASTEYLFLLLLYFIFWSEFLKEKRRIHFALNKTKIHTYKNREYLAR